MSEFKRKNLYFILFPIYLLVYFVLAYVLSKLAMWSAISFNPLPSVIVDFLGRILLGCLLFARVRLGASLPPMRLRRAICMVLTLAVWILMLFRWNDAPMLLLFFVQCGLDFALSLRRPKTEDD